MKHITLVLIMDSNLDIGLLDPNGKHNPEIVNQLQELGKAVDSEIQEIIALRYNINISKVTLLKHNNFILLKEPKRVRVFMVE